MHRCPLLTNKSKSVRNCTSVAKPVPVSAIIKMNPRWRWPMNRMDEGLAFPLAALAYLGALLSPTRALDALIERMGVAE